MIKKIHLKSLKAMPAKGLLLATQSVFSTEACHELSELALVFYAGTLSCMPQPQCNSLLKKTELHSPTCFEGLTAIIQLNEEEFALTWQKMSHGPWQQWQIVMAASRLELCNPFLTVTTSTSEQPQSSKSALHLAIFLFLSFENEVNKEGKI